MACTDHGKRITSITHGAVTLGQPIGGSVRESVTFKLDRPSTRKAPCASMDEYDLTATARFEDLVTPIVRGTSATLTYTLQQMDETTMTVAITAMRMGGSEIDMDAPIHNQTYTFQYDSADSENFAPVTVA